MKTCPLASSGLSRVCVNLCLAPPAACSSLQTSTSRAYPATISTISKTTCRICQIGQTCQTTGQRHFWWHFRMKAVLKVRWVFVFFFGKKIINIYVIDSSSFPEVRFTYVQKLYWIMRLDIIFPLRKAFSRLTKKKINIIFFVLILTSV